MERRLIYTVLYFSKNVKNTIQLQEFAIDKSVKIRHESEKGEKKVEKFLHLYTGPKLII